MQTEENNFQISKTVKGTLPGLPFKDIKEEVLPQNYNLSLVFAGDYLTKKLNKIYRNKNYIPNVLAFPLDKNSGEIFINLKQAKKESADYGYSYNKFIAFLFIHALFHLKGMSHGSRMENEEKKIRDKFKIIPN